MHLLIPYVDAGEVDPDFSEFSYGDAGPRGKKLLTKVGRGDYVFFHTTIRRTKVITAYYVVDRCIRVSDALENKNIMAKYRNPHLRRGKILNEYDMVLFGDPIESRKLERPLVFGKRLARRLRLGIQFRDGFSESQTIGSATRTWRELTADDVDALLAAIRDLDTKGPAPNTIHTTEEVSEVIEKDIENFIVRERDLFGRGLKLVARQMDTPVGRIDLLYESRHGKKVVVELKMGLIGREAVVQLRRYMDHMRKSNNGEVRGVIICEGVLPAFEEEYAKGLKDIKILRHGWRLAVEDW